MGLVSTRNLAKRVGRRTGRLALVAAGLGAVGVASVVSLASGVWSTPVTLSTPIPPTYYAASPAVAVASTGAQAAAWINESNYLLPASTILGSGNAPFFTAVGGYTAATWIGPGPAIQVSDANTP